MASEAERPPAFGNPSSSTVAAAGFYEPPPESGTRPSAPIDHANPMHGVITENDIITFNSLFDEYCQTYRILQLLVVVQGLLWFPIGLAFQAMAMRGRLGRGRLHWQIGYVFLALALVGIFVLSILSINLFVFMALILTPHLGVAVCSVAYGTKHDSLEEALRMVDEMHFQSRLDKFLDLLMLEAKMRCQRFLGGGTTLGVTHAHYAPPTGVYGGSPYAGASVGSYGAATMA